jgi:alkanesulfonate monooxygenase SsuD/methylene tetrahydromethanopterin reductase-like flavin-dependent oxidoreductase (luciferase family)
VIFVAYPNAEIGRRDYAAFKSEVARAGREPDGVKIAQLINTVTAASQAEAEDKWAAIDKLPLEIDALSLLSEALNFDFATKGMDEAFTAAELAQMSGLQGIRDRVLAASANKDKNRNKNENKNPTVRDFIEISGRGRVHNAIVGDPKEVADRLEEWFIAPAPACDGFVLSATHVPGAYEDFVRLVVPELQRRGLFRKEFGGTTLRDNLGLPVPAAGAWRVRFSFPAP